MIGREGVIQLEPGEVIQLPVRKARKPCDCGRRALQLYYFAGFRFTKLNATLKDKTGFAVPWIWVKEKHTRAAWALFWRIGPSRFALAVLDLIGDRWAMRTRRRVRRADKVFARVEAEQMMDALSVPNG